MPYISIFIDRCARTGDDAGVKQANLHLPAYRDGAVFEKTWYRPTLVSPVDKTIICRRVYHNTKERRRLIRANAATI